LILGPPNVVKADNPVGCDVRKKDDCIAHSHEPLIYPQKLSQRFAVTLWKQK